MFLKWEANISENFLNKVWRKKLLLDLGDNMVFLNSTKFVNNLAFAIVSFVSIHPFRPQYSSREMNVVLKITGIASMLYDVANFADAWTGLLEASASVIAMADDQTHVPRAKGRSASICASSLEAISPLMTAGIPNGGTPQSRRRKPATRSQSARLNNNRSIKRRTTVAANQLEPKTNSEPKLINQDATPEVSPNIRRKGSTKRGTSVYHHRKSTAFLDVPESRTRGSPDEESEDSYRLRSFSFTSKGKLNFNFISLCFKSLSQISLIKLCV